MTREIELQLQELVEKFSEKELGVVSALPWLVGIFWLDRFLVVDEQSELADEERVEITVCRSTSYASVILCLERVEDSIPATIEVEDQHIHYEHWIAPLALSPEDPLPFPPKSSQRKIRSVHVSHLIHADANLQVGLPR